MKKSKIEDAT